MTPERWKQLDAAYQQALDLEIGERTAFLAWFAGEDEELGAELALLLANRANARSFLSQPALEAIAEAIAIQSPVQKISVGQTYGVYQIVSLLGRGGMGEVHLARDTKLARDVAIKTLPSDVLHDAEILAGFQREARMQAALNHPHIGAIYGFEQVGHLPFLVLEYVPGETLAERIRRGPLSWTEAAPIFRKIAEALAYAHARNIIHRDLKPANIKITPEGNVKVLDFGLAKIVSDATTTLKLNPSEPGEASTRELFSTAPGVAKGTPPYMSPEQLRASEVDHRTDLWAFGCVFYEALVGRRPFDGVRVINLITAITQQEPDWDALPKNVPASIRQLLRHCLDKNPRQRLSSAAEVLKKLDATRPEPPRRLYLTWRAALAMAVGVVLLVVGWFVFHVEPVWPKRKILAVTAFAISGDKREQFSDPAFGLGLAKALSASLERADGLQVIVPEGEALATTSVNYQEISRRLGATLLLLGEATRTGEQLRLRYQLMNAQGQPLANGTVERPMKELPQARSQVAQAVLEALGLAKTARAALVEAFRDPRSEERYLRALGYLQYNLDLEQVDKARGLLEALIPIEGESALLHAALARAYFYKYKLKPVESESVEAARTACQRALELEPELPEVKLTQAMIQHEAGEYEQARDLFQQVLARRPNNFEAQRGLAASYEFSNHPLEAEQTYRSLIELRPDDAGAHNELGGFFYNRGQYAQAAASWQRVIDLLPGNYAGYTNLGHAHYAQGSYDTAREYYVRSLIISRTHEAYSGLGAVYYCLHDYEAAARAYRQGLDIDNGDPLLWGNLGEVLQLLPGREAEARTAYDRAIELRRAALRDNPRNAQGFAGLAEWLVKRGEVVEAEIAIRRALELAPEDTECAASAASVYLTLGRRSQAEKYAARAGGLAGAGCAPQSAATKVPDSPSNNAASLPAGNRHKQR